MAKTILHLDMNSYFASVEQQLNPSLRGKSVGVIKAPGRTCVIAASIEAKKYGVKTGTTTYDARRLCPQIVFVPSQMNHYLEITKKIIGVAEGYSPIVDVFSIDEMFLDITDTQSLWPGGSLQIALEIKQKIRTDVGDWLKCSIGVGWSKLSAKTASEMHKPNGLTFLTPINYLLLTNNLPVSEVCGIGYSRAKYLQSRGAFTLGQARALPDLPTEISDLIFLRNDDSLTPSSELLAPKSVSRTYTTYQTTSHKSQVTSLVRNLIEEACGKLREMGMGGRTFGLVLKSPIPKYLTPTPSPNLGEGQYSYKFRKTLANPTDDPEIIFQMLTKEELPDAVRFAGIWISNLVFSIQYSVFGKRENLLKSVDKINGKFGLFTVYPARLLGSELIRPEVTGFLGDKYYQLQTQGQKKPRLLPDAEASRILPPGD